MIEQPGIYQIPLEEYLRDPAPVPSLSASLAHTLLERSPRHAWMQHPRLNPAYEREDSSRLELGTIAHALLLEDDDSRVVVIDAADWRTKAVKEQRDEARAAGQLPILAGDYETVQAMVTTARQAIDASDELCEAWAGGTSEQTLLWQEGETWCRSRPDRHSSDWRVLFDYKTAAGSASPLVWGRTHILAHGYDLQAALALRGVRRLRQPHDCTFLFVVQELDPPHAVSFPSLDPAYLDIAEQKLAAALALWRQCLRTNDWPGYPARVAYLEPPAWAMQWGFSLPELNAEDLT